MIHWGPLPALNGQSTLFIPFLNESLLGSDVQLIFDVQTHCSRL